ncbi:MAG: thiamine pyrophosphate-binding protein [Candidatus Tectomicrobia bacterium]|uniref:Thiamine pyrophosphate-binding protein n=1 Tax=Tectimicrobiota bacterium TaxID=2528274 RepID=A0A933LQZ7_UNCTE|nr:thiamine pyrophosphate-binding protein [Candidatus Tectomicrobia bacterium]
MRKPSRSILLDMLVNQGVEYVFGNPGTTELPLMDAIQDYPQLKYLLALQESTSVAMAEGYARATKKPGFVNLHIAGGLANGLSMLYNAFRAGTPLVLTAGQSDTRLLLEEPLLSGNLVEMCRQYTKWSAEVLHGTDVPTAIRRAFRTALTPPTGPVFLSLPFNVLDEEIELHPSPPSPVLSKIRPDPRAIEQAVGVLAKAQNPLLLVGDRVAQAGAVPDAVRAAELLGAMVMAPMLDSSEVNFPTSHGQFGGILNTGSPETRAILARHDVILAIGCNVFTQFLYIPQLLSGNERLIHLDVDVREIEKSNAVTVGIWGDIRASLEELNNALDGSMSSSEREAARTRRMKVEEGNARMREDVLAIGLKNWDQKPMNESRLFLEMKKVIPENTIFVVEAPTSLTPFLNAIDLNEPGTCFINIRGGALGWAVGAALGVKLAKPNLPVVCILGDGSAMYSIQGLWTAARYDLPVVYIVCNNRSYRILKHFMKNYYFPLLGLKDRKSEYPGMNFFEHPLDCASVAEGFGVRGFKVDDPVDLKPTLEKAFALGKPALIDVHVHSGDY